MSRSRRTPPPRAAAPASTSTPKRSSRFLTATRPPDSAKTNTPTRSRASCEVSASKVQASRGRNYPSRRGRCRGATGPGWQSRAPTTSRGDTGEVRNAGPATRSASRRTASTCCSSDPEGDRFRLALDEPLRAAARRDRAPAGPAPDRDRRRYASARGPGADPGRSYRPRRSPTGPAGRSRRSAATRGRSSPSASTSRTWPARVRLRGGGSGGVDRADPAGRVAQRLRDRGVDPEPSRVGRVARRRGRRLDRRR